MPQLNLLGDLVDIKPRKKGLGGVGCEYCPLDGIPGLRKIKGLINIKKRKAMLWGQSPGGTENIEGLAFVGPAGKFLWEALAEVGIERSDFDIQNVVRCRPINEDGKGEHPPTKKELHCCSIYNTEALNLNGYNADVHLILGEPAGKQLLGREYRKDRPIFWHEPWNAYVVLANHPSYVLRCGGKGAGYIYYTFKDRMRAVKTILDHPGRFGYVNSLDHGAITTHEQMATLKKEIYKRVAEGETIDVDIEDGKIDDRRVIIMVGFGWGKGETFKKWKGAARSVILEHKETGKTGLEKEVREILEDPQVKKAMQNGSYDCNTLQEILAIRVQGYEFDTQYGAYLKNSHMRSYSFASMCSNFFTEFADYKENKRLHQPGMMGPWTTNFAEAPLKVLVPYNCADCILTNRIRNWSAPHVNKALVKVYIHAGFVLEAMESRGPKLNRRRWKELRDIVEEQMAPLHRDLTRLAWEGFNPATPQQVAKLLFDKLKLTEIEGRSTDAEYLEILFQRTKHPAVRKVLQWRALAVIRNTFLIGWMNSAENSGVNELRTIWHLTGAVTGRLRSGKGKEAEKEGICNFQNFTGNRIVQNVLISDENWHKALNGSLEEALDLEIDIAFDNSQVELRMLAEISQDPLMIKQFNAKPVEGKPWMTDIHCLIGKELTGWDPQVIKEDPDVRRSVKEFNFSLVFGVGKNSIFNHLVSKGVKITKSKAELFYDRFFRIYTGVSQLIRRLRNQAETKGYVETIFGFRREVRQEDEGRGSYWGNQAINTPIQGSAHGLILIVLALLHLKPRTYKLLQKPFSEVHDALYWRIKFRDIQEAYRLGKHLMEVETAEYTHKHFGRKLSVPLVSEAKAGFTLGSMADYSGEDPKEFLIAWRKKYHAIEAHKEYNKELRPNG